MEQVLYAIFISYVSKYHWLYSGHAYTVQSSLRGIVFYVVQRNIMRRAGYSAIFSLLIVVIDVSHNVKYLGT
jgi:hypothetical protein